MVIFKGIIIGGELMIDNQALDLRWLTKEEIAQKLLRWGLLKDLILTN